MSNPVFNNSGIFGDPRDPKVRERRSQLATDPAWGTPSANGSIPYSTTYGPAPYGAAPYGTAGPQPMDAASLESMYAAPSATNVQMRRMTYDDVIMRTGGLLALLVLVAVGGYALTPSYPALVWVGMGVGFVLGMVNAFKRNPSPALIIAYTVAQGLFLGGISYVFQNVYVGGADVQPIILQAVLATFATFGAALLLFRSGKVRVTPKFTKWLFVALAGYAAFSLLNFVLSFFVASEGFGPLRSGPWGIIIGLVAVGMAAASLIVDFDSIKRGVDGGVPTKYAWSASFGLMVTLIWLYLELLRLFAMFAGRR